MCCWYRVNKKKPGSSFLIRARNLCASVLYSSGLGSGNWILSEKFMARAVCGNGKKQKTINTKQQNKSERLLKWQAPAEEGRGGLEGKWLRHRGSAWITKLRERQTQSTTIPYCKIKMKALFPSKKEKEKRKQQKGKTMLFTRTVNEETVMFRKTNMSDTPTQTPRHQSDCGLVSF